MLIDWYWGGGGLKLRKLITKDWVHVFPGLISGGQLQSSVCRVWVNGEFYGGSVDVS